MKSNESGVSTGILPVYLCLIRSDSAFRLSKVCSSLNCDLMMIARVQNKDRKEDLNRRTECMADGSMKQADSQSGIIATICWTEPDGLTSK